MRLTRSLATAGVLALALTACGQAEEAMNDASDQAKEKAGEAAESAKDEAGEKAGEAADSAKDKAGEAAESAKDKAGGGSGSNDGQGGSGDGSGDGQGGSGGDAVTVEYGEFSDDPAAQAAGNFLTVRSEAVQADDPQYDGLSEVATTQWLDESVRTYVQDRGGQVREMTVEVVGSQQGTVDVCAAGTARSITVEGDKVAETAEGDHTC